MIRTTSWGAGDNSGDLVAEQFRDDGFFNSRWTFSLTGMVKIAPERPWGFDLSANVAGRDGYPLPYYATVVGSDGISRDIQVTRNVDSFRNEDLITIDLGVRKEIPIEGDYAAMIDLTVFNLLNEATVLERGLQLNGPRGDFLNAALSPRIIRVGVRLQWN